MSESLLEDEDIMCSLIKNSPVNDCNDSGTNTCTSIDSEPEVGTCNGNPPPINVQLDRSSNTLEKCNYRGEVGKAFIALKRVAKERGFIVKDVPGDGDCMFNAILPYLQRYIEFDVQTLRELLADHFRKNYFYSNFVPDILTIDNNPFNNDMEAADEYDIYIASLSDPEEQKALRYVITKTNFVFTAT